jgi:hypothetical protein
MSTGAAAAVSSSLSIWDVQNFSLNITSLPGTNNRIVTGSFDVIHAGDGDAVLPARFGGGSRRGARQQQLTIQFQGNVI